MKDDARIFVQIASYRDPECEPTLADLFARAAAPDRISVGLCWQHDPGEGGRRFADGTRPSQVRRLDVPASESRGVCWARHLAQQLWRGEEYTLVTDSHMRFAPGWDDKLIDELHECPSPRPALTCNPARYQPPDRLEP